MAPVYNLSTNLRVSSLQTESWTMIRLRGRAALAGGATLRTKSPGRQDSDQRWEPRQWHCSRPIRASVRPSRPRDHLADVAAHFRRAGGRNQGYAPIIDQPFAYGRAIPITRLKMAGSTPLARPDALADLDRRNAVSGVWLEGFHTVASPHTAASALFQAQTATGN